MSASNKQMAESDSDSLEDLGDCDLFRCALFRWMYRSCSSSSMPSPLPGLRTRPKHPSHCDRAGRPWAKSEGRGICRAVWSSQLASDWELEEWSGPEWCHLTTIFSIGVSEWRVKKVCEQ